MGIEKSKEELGERSRYTGGAVTRCLMKWLAVFVSIITLFLALPAMTCWKERYECRHTFVDGKQLRFDGYALQLMGKYICWVLLTLITFFVYGFWLSVKMKKWKIKHTHFADEPFCGEVKTKAEKIASMSEEERAVYEQKQTSRRNIAHMAGLAGLVLDFIMPPAGLIAGIAGIIFGAIAREKTGLRLGTVAVSLILMIPCIILPFILSWNALQMGIIIGCGAVFVIAACVTVFIITKNWESYSATENKEK